jgi:hypothetical protein
MTTLALECPVCEMKVDVPARFGKPHDEGVPGEAAVDVDVDVALYREHVLSHMN